jgi:hypothetical protein
LPIINDRLLGRQAGGRGIVTRSNGARLALLCGLEGVPADSDGEGSFGPVAARVDWLFAVDVASCVGPDFVGVAVVACFVGMGMGATVFMGVRVV